MKNTIFFVLSVLCSTVYAQKFNKTYVGEKIDTVYLFAPFGEVSSIIDNRTMISTELSMEVRAGLEVELERQMAGNCFILVDSMVANDRETQKKVYSTVDKVREFDTELFSKVPIPNKLDSLLVEYPGRYAGFVYYSGFFNTKANIAGTVFTSVWLAAATMLLTGGMCYAYVVPDPSYVELTLLLVDKETKHFVYYSKKRRESSVSVKANYYNKLVKKLLKKYKKRLSQEI